jgi:hypothetical protein
MSGADASVGEVVDLNEGPAQNIQQILEWVDQFGCLRTDATDGVPCKGDDDDAEVCVVCAASYMLGCAEERHAHEKEEHEQRQERLARMREAEGG